MKHGEEDADIEAYHTNRPGFYYQAGTTDNKDRGMSYYRWKVLVETKCPKDDDKAYEKQLEYDDIIAETPLQAMLLGLEKFELDPDETTHGMEAKVEMVEAVSVFPHG